jgi:hypothetical protein
MQQSESLKVEVLSIRGCGSTRSTIEMIESAAADLNVPVEITETVINSQEEAERRRFLGSPTVLVEGIDIYAPDHGPVPSSYGLI